MQHDHLYATLTVRETLRFAANILLREPKHERDERVERIMSHLHLDMIADSIIGSEMKRGEK